MSLTHRLGDSRLADLIGLIKNLSMEVVQNGRRVTDADEVDHGVDVPKVKQHIT